MLRHNHEGVEDYREQMKYWAQLFPHSSDEDEVNTVEMSEYIFNNMIWNDDTEEIDRIRVALFLGMVTGKNAEIDEELIYGVH